MANTKNTKPTKLAIPTAATGKNAVTAQGQVVVILNELKALNFEAKLAPIEKLLENARAFVSSAVNDLTLGLQRKEQEHEVALQSLKATYDEREADFEQKYAAKVAGAEARFETLKEENTTTLKALERQVSDQEAINKRALEELNYSLTKSKRDMQDAMTQSVKDYKLAAIKEFAKEESLEVHPAGTVESFEVQLAAYEAKREADLEAARKEGASEVYKKHAKEDKDLKTDVRLLEAQVTSLEETKAALQADLADAKDQIRMIPKQISEAVDKASASVNNHFEGKK